MDVVDRPTDGTSPPSSDPEQQFIIIDLDPDHNRQPRRPLSAVKELKLQKGIQPRRLLLGARKAVQNKSPVGIRLAQTPSHDIANQIVGDQFTPSNDSLHLNAKRRLLLHVLAQQVAGRNLRNVVVLSDSLRLGAFTCARWPEKHNGSDSPQNLLRHRTGPKPLLYQIHH